MHQTWGKLLFLHWPISTAELRPHIPSRLEIDTYDDTAWIGVTPFSMWGVRPAGLPRFPFASTTLELNVRTYVHLNGIPGVWFFSLDASNPAVVAGARLGFALPYFKARMTLRENDGGLAFTSRRIHGGAPPAMLDASWTRGGPLRETAPGSLEFFLIERYCLYAVRGRRLLRSRIYHPPWTLRKASLSTFSSTMIQSHGIPAPPGEPLLHAQGEPMGVDVWSPETV